MQVYNIQSSDISFGIKVSPHFIKTAQNQYHYNNVPNKRHLIWKLMQKVEDYAKFGYDEYTLDYEKKLLNGNGEHYLVAIRDDGKSKVNIFHRSTLAKIVDRFMQMNKHELDTKFAKR